MQGYGIARTVDGVLEPWMVNAFDIAGDARVIGNGPNMGCYESVFAKGIILSIQ